MNRDYTRKPLKTHARIQYCNRTLCGLGTWEVGPFNIITLWTFDKDRDAHPTDDPGLVTCRRCLATRDWEDCSYHVMERNGY